LPFAHPAPEVLERCTEYWSPQWSKPILPHAQALPWLQRAKNDTDTWLVAAHSLAELYAVLTTLPLQPRFPQRATYVVCFAIFGNSISLVATNFLLLGQRVSDIIYQACRIRSNESSQTHFEYKMNSYRAKSQNAGVVGTRPDIMDGSQYARQNRAKAEKCIRDNDNK
jgi:hypothetical protein